MTTVDEAARLHLLEKARDTMDDEAAKTLLAGLAWDIDRFATKADLQSFEQRINGRFDRLFWQMAVAVIAINATFVGAIGIGVQLAR